MGNSSPLDRFGSGHFRKWNKCFDKYVDVTIPYGLRTEQISTQWCAIDKLSTECIFTWFSCSVLHYDRAASMVTTYTVSTLKELPEFIFCALCIREKKHILKLIKMCYFAFEISLISRLNSKSKGWIFNLWPRDKDSCKIRAIKCNLLRRKNNDWAITYMLYVNFGVE